MGECYYVYGAFGVDDELLYIGKGKGSRWKHCSSGISSSKALNRYYFLNGEGDCVTARILHRFSSNSKAVKKEKELISLYQPPFNLDGVGQPKTALLTEALEYYKRLECYLRGMDEKVGKKMYINWLEKIKHFIKGVGYARLKEGIPINKKSLKVHNDDRILGLYRSVVSHSTAPDGVRSIFEIEKVGVDFYHIKLNLDLF